MLLVLHYYRRKQKDKYASMMFVLTLLLRCMDMYLHEPNKFRENRGNLNLLHLTETYIIKDAIS